MKTLPRLGHRVLPTLIVALAGLLLTFGGLAVCAHADELADPAQPERKAGGNVVRFSAAAAQVAPAAKEGNGCSVQQAAPAGKDAVGAFLSRKVVIAVDGMKMGEFAKALSDLGGIQIVMDRTALEAINIGDDTLVTANFSGTTLRAALRHVLRQIDPTLIAVPQDGTIMITTKEEAQQHLLRTVYNVRDLAAQKPKRPFIQHARAGSLPNLDQSFSGLIDLIQQCVEPSSWDREGGVGDIKTLGPGVLIVSQTSDVQERVAALLETLCVVREAQKNKAEGALRPRVVATGTQREFVDRVHKAMTQQVQLNFEQEKLENVVALLSQICGLPILLDKIALDAININDESLVTAQVKNVSLRSALELVLRALDPTLTWSYQQEALVITTREETSNHMSFVVYPVHDLTHPDPAHGLPAISPEDLEEMIAASVEPAGWDSEGGPGSVKYAAACDALVIAQTDVIQEQVLALLDDVRKIRSLQRVAKPEAKIAARPAVVDEAADQGTCVVIYHLGPVGPQPLLRWPLAAATIASKQDMTELKKTIIESVGADKWPENETSIRSVANKFIIRQTPAAHDKIGQLLTQLDVLEPKSVSTFGGQVSGAPAGGFNGAFGR